MKAKILITGQINGNCTLKNKLSVDAESIRFNGFVAEYRTIKEAKADLRSVWKSLKSEGLIDKTMDSLSKDGERLSYDASLAELVRSE